MIRSVRRASARASGTPRKISAHQDDSGRIDGDVRTRADRDSHVRSRQSRSIVNAIAHHRHATALGPEPRYLALLVFGQHFREHVRRVDAGLARNLQRHAPIVTRDHPDFNAHQAETFDGLFRFGLNLVGDIEFPRALSVDVDGDRARISAPDKNPLLGNHRLGAFSREGAKAS